MVEEREVESKERKKGRKGERILMPFRYTQATLLPPKIVNSEVNTQALQFRTLNMVNETRNGAVQSEKDHR